MGIGIEKEKGFLTKFEGGNALATTLGRFGIKLLYKHNVHKTDRPSPQLKCVCLDRSEQILSAVYVDNEVHLYRSEDGLLLRKFHLPESIRALESISPGIFTAILNILHTAKIFGFSKS